MGEAECQIMPYHGQHVCYSEADAKVQGKIFAKLGRTPAGKKKEAKKTSTSNHYSIK